MNTYVITVLKNGSWTTSKLFSNPISLADAILAVHYLNQFGTEIYSYRKAN